MSAAATGLSPKRVKKPYDKAAFHELHESVGKVDYLPDFNPAVEALIRDTDSRFRYRVLALIKLQSWANQKRFAVHDEWRNKPFLEADVARYFGVSRELVNRAVRVLKAKCLLTVEEGRLIPIADPVAEMERWLAQASTPAIDVSSPHIRPEERDRWFAEHPKELRLRKRIFKVLEQQKRRMRQDILTARKSTPSAQELEARSGQPVNTERDKNARPGVTEEASILMEISNKPLKPSSSAFSESEQPAKKPTTKALPPASPKPNQTQYAVPSPERERLAVIEAAVSGYVSDARDVARQIDARVRREDPEAGPEEIAGVVREKGELLRSGRYSAANPAGFLIEAVGRAFPRAKKQSEVPDHLLPTSVKRLRGLVAEAEQQCRDHPGDEQLASELVQIREMLVREEEEYGVRARPAAGGRTA